MTCSIFFSIGMNCHLKNKFDSVKKKVNVELLYDKIKDLEASRKLVIQSDDVLKSELERFGLSHSRDFNSDLLTKFQYQKIKNFNSNDKIITRKADKSNVFVIMDKHYYNQQIDGFLTDITKFHKIEKDPTDQLKREINACIRSISDSSGVKLPKREGKYVPGYVYGNPKIHKRLVNPPLRPIISQIGTVTYDISKKLDSIISPYIPRKYSIKSSYEFLQLLNGHNPSSGILASLDVESLFTNVPVNATIDIIIKCVYENDTMTPPALPADVMRKLLTICTTKTPFHDHHGNLYVQSEGVSMGSALGPTFAEFYMCDLENRVFSDNPNLKPIIYARYVDDCFLFVDKFETLTNIRTMFEQHSVLHFTYEIESSRRLSFLDVIINRCRDNFETSVHIKKTSSGDCINYKSICPDRYKIGIIKTLLNRGFRISSNWSLFHEEINRIKQLLTNNNFPMKIIDETVQKFMDKIYNNTSPAAVPNEKISIYYESQMTSYYKTEERRLKEIIYSNVLPSDESKLIQVIIYYRNRKMKNLFIKNRTFIKEGVANKYGVVYRFVCKNDGCHPGNDYIGYTTCTLSERFRMHTFNGSIKKHLIEHHHFNKIHKAELLETTEILRHCRSKRELIMTEAVLIKQHRPRLNAQDEGADRILKIFKH